MMELQGQYTTAKIFTVNNSETIIDQHSIAQIQAYIDHEVSKDCKIRIMPDVQAGKGCVVGFTSTIGDSIMPAVIGIDIGCGVTAVKLSPGSRLEPQKLDRVIRENIPSGFTNQAKTNVKYEALKELRCPINIHRANSALGTLGGGNHFIEVDKDEDDNLYLVVHSGSRNAGTKVAEYYMNKGQERLKELYGIHVPPEIVTISGDLKVDYLNDIAVMHSYAFHNRALITKRIAKEMKWKIDGVIESAHNYIDFSDDDNPIIRKGAISAKEGEKVVIPINMRDGIILGTGKGNPDWNYSAPHGAGRILSRSEAKEKFIVHDFKESMKGIYSSCINSKTLDECPFAYRSINDILEVIGDTITVDKIIKPVYNFKAE